MKIHFTFFLLFLLLLSFSAFAQGDKEDVIYLKNGSTYRGTIIEQIPNASYKIEIAGGSVIVVQAADVDSVLKEKKASSSGYYISDQRPMPLFHYKTKGYFLQAQSLAELFEIGFRLVNGYKFGQFGYLGFGLGVEEMLRDLRGNENYGGGYTPIYIYYAGDITRKNITPFYTVEAGYAFRPKGLQNYSDAQYTGQGPTGGTGGFRAGLALGVRFYSRRRVHFDLSAHIDIQMASENYVQQIYVSNGSYNSYYSTNEVIIIPGLRFGIGFLK